MPRTELYRKEKYDSSDSDCSIRNNRKKQILESIEMNSELPENMKNIYQGEQSSLNNSEDYSENCYTVNDYVHSCEDNLTNEIERILIDIYNNHISYETNKKKLDISRYEKHVQFF